MKKYTFSVQNLAAIFIVIYLTVYFLIIAQGILVPITFAVILSLLLKPWCEKVESYISYRPAGISLVFGSVILLIIGIVLLFSLQLIDLFQNVDDIYHRLQAGVVDVYQYLNGYFNVTDAQRAALLKENTAQIILEPIEYLVATLKNSSFFLVNLVLVLIYTFLILLYRNAIKKFILIQFGDPVKGDAAIILNKIKRIVQQYLYGVFLVIMILSVLNSIGLSLIGIQYAIFWGILAAFLAVIPYIGTIIGGLLPFIFALSTTDNYWQPLSVIGLFVVVQFIEGNLITPRVVGSSIKLNPLASIIGLLVGGTIWGISGLVLALPLLAIIRLIFSRINALKPVGLLLSDKLFKNDEIFAEQFDEDKFRLFNLFGKKEHNLKSAKKSVLRKIPSGNKEGKIS